MFPIGDDDTSRRTTPVVTYALIALNLLFFFVELNGGDPFIQQWSVVPRRLLANPAADFPTIFTSMFMHAGWLHLGGNMLYLWIFGDNVEDSFGHLKFLVFICFAVLPRPLRNSPSVLVQTCRTSERREQSPVCLALTFCFSRADR